MAYRDDHDALAARRDELARELADIDEQLRDRKLLASVKIARPCSERWDAMTGDERVRFCTTCRKKVFNLSAMSTREAAALVRERTGETCVRLYKRADGTVKTADCPRRLAANGAGLAIAICVAGIASFASLAFALDPPVQRAQRVAVPPVADEVVPKHPHHVIQGAL